MYLGALKIRAYSVIGIIAFDALRLKLMLSISDQAFGLTVEGGKSAGGIRSNRALRDAGSENKSTDQFYGRDIRGDGDSRNRGK